MPLTLDEITAREDALLDQIAECKRLLAAYQLLRADHAKSLAATRDASTPQEFEPEAAPEPATPPAPAVPEVNLQALSKGYGGGIRAVTWAIRQMTGDFTVHQIAAALRQAGCPFKVEKISIVLNRMKDARKIEEVTCGRGRTPSTFRATVAVTVRPLELCARHCQNTLRLYSASR